tara:strand:- start:369 stop:659 length:291 start_codon:yes stop_codon:yes gene_type:complete
MRNLSEIKTCIESNSDIGRMSFRQLGFNSGFDIILILDDEQIVFKVREFCEDENVELLYIESNLEFTEVMATKHDQEIDVDSAIEQLNEYIDQFDV